MSSGGFEASQSPMYPRYEPRRSSTNTPMQSYDRSFNYVPRRRSPSPGPPRRFSYDSYIPTRAEVPYRNEYPNVYRPSSYRPGYSPGSYYNRSPSPNRFPTYARSPDAEPWDRANVWQSPLKASASWQERKPLPPSPVRERVRRDDTMATRIFEPSDTWRRDHVDRPPLPTLDRHPNYRRDGSDTPHDRMSRFNRSSVIYPGGDRYRPGENHRESFNVPRPDYDSYRPPYETSWDSPPSRDYIPGSDRKDAPGSGQRSSNHYEPYPERRLSGSISTRESVSPKSQIQSPSRPIPTVSPRGLERDGLLTDKLYENEQPRRSYSVNNVNSSFLSRPSSRSSIASTLHSEKANSTVLNFPPVQDQLQTTEKFERQFHAEYTKQDAAKPLSLSSYLPSPTTQDDSKVFESQDKVQNHPSRARSKDTTMDNATEANQIVSKGETDLRPDEPSQSQMSNRSSSDNVHNLISPSMVVKALTNTINLPHPPDSSSSPKPVHTGSVVPTQGQEQISPRTSAAVAKEGAIIQSDLPVDVSGEDLFSSVPSIQPGVSKAQMEPSQQEEEADEFNAIDGHGRIFAASTLEGSKVDTSAMDTTFNITDRASKTDTSIPIPPKHPISPEGSTKSDRDIIKDGLRLVVITRLLCDHQTREERANPVLLANLALGQPTDPEINETADADAVIRYVMAGSHSEKRMQGFETLKPSLREYFARRRAIVSEKVQHLRKEYIQLHENWLTQCQTLNEQAKPSILEGETVPIGRTTRRSANLGDAVRSDLEMEQILASLGNDDATDPNHLSQRNLATIPDMICVVKGKVDYVFDDTSHRVESPAEYYAPNTGIHDWTEEEKSIFLDKYAAYPKQFGVIAEYLPNKTAAQCVDYYYLHKKGLIDFRKVVSKLGPKRRRKGAGKRKGNALLTDIQRHDEEVHRGSGSPSAALSLIGAPRRGRKPKDKDKDNSDMKESEKKLSGRSSTKRNALQMEKTPTDTSTPEPETKPRRRRGPIAVAASTAPPSRTMSLNLDGVEEDNIEPDPRPAKRAKRTRKIKSAAIVEDDSPTPEAEATALPISTIPMDGKTSSSVSIQLLEQEKNFISEFYPSNDNSAVHYAPQIHSSLHPERMCMLYAASGFVGNSTPLTSAVPPSFLYPPSHSVIDVLPPTGAPLPAFALPDHYQPTEWVPPGT